jgi:hypothetical protein
MHCKVASQPLQSKDLFDITEVAPENPARERKSAAIVSD